MPLETPSRLAFRTSTGCGVVIGMWAGIQVAGDLPIDTVTSVWTYQMGWTWRRGLTLAMVPAFVALAVASSIIGMPLGPLLPLVWSLNAAVFALLAQTTWASTTVSKEGISVHSGFSTTHIPWPLVDRIMSEPGTKNVQISRMDKSAYAFTPLPGVTPEDLPDLRRLREDGEADR